MEVTDSELAENALSGDHDAFELLYERYFSQVYDFCLRMLADPGAAADIAQDTFLKLVGGSSAQFRGGNFRAWLLVTARNATIDELRRRRRTRSLTLFESEGGEEEFYKLPPAIGEDPERAALSVETAQLVWTAARGLNANDYALLDLNLSKGLEPQELAQELNTSIGNVYTRLSRLKRSLEESVTALLLAQMGRRQCAQLDQIPQGTEVTEGIRARTRRRVTTHIGECSTCLANRERYVSAALTFGSLAPVLPAATLKASALAGITSQLLAVGTGGAAASVSGGAGAAGWPSKYGKRWSALGIPWVLGPRPWRQRRPWHPEWGSDWLPSLS